MRPSYKKTEEMKTIGTAAPISALRSGIDGSDRLASGTFETGRLFLAWLAETGQGAWQFLPLSETHLEPGSRRTRVASPYKGYGVGLDPRYLSAKDAGATPSRAALAAFRKEHAAWLPTYALFCALRDRFGTDDWTTWEKGIRFRKPEALRRWRRELAEQVVAHETLQWRLHASYGALRADAKRKDIRILGDLPFYLPLRSPLVWANRACFDLGADGRPRRVSGVPDGPQAHFGRQVWGHPLYRWNAKGAWNAIARLWRQRIRYHAGLYDMMRLDHAKGLFSYGAMDMRTPPRDMVLKGPGAALLRGLIRFARTSGLTIFAEDAGDRLEGLRATLLKLGVPGIRILRFAYNEKRKTIEHDYADPANYREDAVAYTSTHDTETLMGYLRLLSTEEKRHLCAHVRVEYSDDGELLAARLRGAVLASSARFAIIPIQDWLLTRDRINVPGTERATGDRNWRYRVSVPIERLPKFQVTSRSAMRASRSSGSGTAPKR